jgi:hypothetical protein
VGDGYGWWGVLPIVGVGMGRSYPMGMYPLLSLTTGDEVGVKIACTELLPWNCTNEWMCQTRYH